MNVIFKKEQTTCFLRIKNVIEFNERRVKLTKIQGVPRSMTVSE